jgi:hypothetical protein
MDGPLIPRCFEQKFTQHLSKGKLIVECQRPQLKRLRELEADGEKAIELPAADGKKAS